MKKLKVIISIVVLMAILSGCYDSAEPNDLVYTVAMGIDRVDNGNLKLTIQFAKPVQISGGGGEGGGGGSSGSEILDNIVVEAPTLYAGINLANHIVSKRFVMSHVKLMVFSEEVAKEGLNAFTDTMARSKSFRPHIYMAVSTSSAEKYLESVKPMIEISPAKYYKLIYESDYSAYTPKTQSKYFYYESFTSARDAVLPLCGVIAKTQEEEEEVEKEGKQAGQSEGEPSGTGKTGGSESSGGKSGGAEAGTEGGSEGESSGGSQSESQGSKQPGGEQNESKESTQPRNTMALNEEGFEYRLKNYIAGDIPRESKNPSETMGMAIFSGDQMVGTMGGIESELYSILSGEFDYNYTTFENPFQTSVPITVRLRQKSQPVMEVRMEGDTPVVKIKVYLEGDMESLPSDYLVENDLQTFEDSVKQNIQTAGEKLLYRTSQEWNADILGAGERIKKQFLTVQKFEEFNWKEKYKQAQFEVEPQFEVKRTGLTARVEQK
jgi:hypothetical protein